MIRRAMIATAAACLASTLWAAPPPDIDWSKAHQDTLDHFINLLKIDTSSPPGNEFQAVEYLKKVLDKEGIAYDVFSLEPDHANLVARIKGNGSKRPIIVMGHTDVVGVQREKWTVDPFGGVRKDGFIYGRGANDDKDQLTAALMTVILLKRMNIALDRDVIFIAEAGEEGNSRVGIGHLVKEHWNAIEAEYCLAEGGYVGSRDGRIRVVAVATTEKVPRGVTLTAKGTAGHGSVPRLDNPVGLLAQAVAKAFAWEPPMRFNDTTRTYFERLTQVSTPEEAARYRALFDKNKSTDVQRYFLRNEPQHYSILRTSVVPTILRAGFRSNVIPSDATATLDIRALPDEDMPKFLEQLKRVINDPAVEIQPSQSSLRPASPPSRLDSEMFKAIERVSKRMFPTAVVVPSMLTGATDMAQLRGKGVQCYGLGPIFDERDRGGALGGAHSDDERISELGLYKVVEMTVNAVLEVAASK